VKHVMISLAACCVMSLAFVAACDVTDLGALPPEVAELIAGKLPSVERLAAGSGDLLQTRQQDQLRDGSCQMSTGADSLQIQQRDQLRDGSCGGVPALDGSGAQVQAGLGNGDLLRLRDGSCQTQ
jgi:hypothetical protein